MTRYHARFGDDTDKFRMIKEKDKVRKAQKRLMDKSNMPAEELKTGREREATQVRDYRSPVKILGQKNIDSAQTYHSPQTMGKAVSKVKRSLPKSPRKRKAVTVALAEEAGLKFLKMSVSENRGNQGITEELKTEVAVFYSSDEISWQAPGRKRLFALKILSPE